MDASILCLKELFNRDLIKLSKEISSFKNESELWASVEGIENSAGNLCLHICGNLRHFIGAVVLKDGYARDRKHEFNATGLDSTELIRHIEEVIVLVDKGLKSLENQNLEDSFPIEVFGKPMSYHFFILHLYGHLNYHLGQISYFRRIVSNSD